MHSQSPILRLASGVFGILVILTYLREQSCILHTLTKLPAYYTLDLKGIFNAWRTWACRFPLDVAGSVSGKVGSHEQVDLPIHKHQHWTLGDQLHQTCPSLIAHTWPIFDPSRSCTPCEPPMPWTNELVWACQIGGLNVICNFDTVNTGQKETCLYSVKFKSQLTMKLEKKPPKWVIVSSRTADGKDQSINWVK